MNDRFAVGRMLKSAESTVTMQSNSVALQIVDSNLGCTLPYYSVVMFKPNTTPVHDNSTVFRR